MRHSIKIIGLVFILFPSVLAAQDDLKGFSINPRLGSGLPLKYETGVLLGLDASFFDDQNIYTAGYTIFSEFVIFGGEDYITNNINILYGRYRGTKWYRFCWQGGLAPIWGEKRVSDQLSSFNSLGLLLRTGVKLFPTKFAAFSADIQLNLNPEVPNFTVMLGLDIGKLLVPEE